MTDEWDDWDGRPIVLALLVQVTTDANFDIFNMLRQAALEEHELQVISDTVKVHGAVPIWSVHECRCGIKPVPYRNDS